MSFIFNTIPEVTPIEIRSPDFGDQIRVNNNDIRRFTVGGNKKTYASTDWAKLVNRTYSFSVINSTLVADIRAFFLATAGHPISITDHLENTYTGFIVTPVLEIISTRPDCSYSITFEFMEEPS